MFSGFFYLSFMKNENQIFGIRAIIEVIQSGTIIDKVFIQKESQGDLMRELLK
jgi:23S rRNA (guanosine2251-2'-O)-methyltransferase